MYKAVFIDVDGTLIKSDHTVSEPTKQTIQQLIEKKILVVLVSARPLDGILPISKRIGALDLPIASLNGGYIVLNNKVIFESFIDLSIASQLHEQLMTYNVTLLYYQRRECFGEIMNTHVEKEQRVTKVPVIIQPFADTLKQWKFKLTGPNKILIISTPDAVRKMQKTLLSQYGDTLNICSSKPSYLEIMNSAASKTNAIKFLLKKYNLKREEIIVIGDNFNDKEMIEFGGMGIAMGNAPDEVKAAANFVTDTNNNDGVHKALQKFMAL
jgi:Cof subfamily protein (haloacid dehalogenase superfamily)